MADTASETIQIAAPLERVWEIAADFERYPDWARDVKDVVVRSRDHDQRPSEVEYRASALGRSTHYTLTYDYSQAPHVLAWKMLKGDIQSSIEGAYHFSPTDDGGTEVRYDLEIELAAPLPGFVKRRAEVRILNTVRELKIRAEGSGMAGGPIPGEVLLAGRERPLPAAPPAVPELQESTDAPDTAQPQQGADGQEP